MTASKFSNNHDKRGEADTAGKKLPIISRWGGNAKVAGTSEREGFAGAPCLRAQTLPGDVLAEVGGPTSY